MVPLQARYLLTIESHVANSNIQFSFRYLVYHRSHDIIKISRDNNCPWLFSFLKE